MKPTSPLPEVLACDTQEEVLARLAPPPPPDHLRDGLRSTAATGRHAPAVTEPWAREPIAIVGIGCRLPGGISDPDDLWKALLDARDCVVDIPGSRWDPQKFLDPTGRAPGRSAKEAAEDVIKLFEGFSEEARHERVQSLLAKIVAGVLQMDETRFDFSQPLHEVGLDSIMALEIAAGIEKTLGLRLSAMDLAAGPSIETLATTIVGRLAGPPSDERAA